MTSNNTEVVMEDLTVLLKRKRALLSEFMEIGDMRRGSITEQYLETKRKDGKVVRNGPYLLYSYKDKDQKTIARRLKQGSEADLYRRQIENFRRYEALSREHVDICHRICEMKEQGCDGNSTEGVEKKQRGSSAKKSKTRSNS